MNLPLALLRSLRTTARVFFLATATLTAPVAAAGQSAPDAPPVQDWSNNIETVTVTGVRPGPALWHIAANGSDVWILGTVEPMPKGLDWNSDALKTILDGAKQAYLPPELSAGFFEMSWFLLTDLDSLKQPDGRHLEETLPPALRARFVAARTALGKDANAYSDDLAALSAYDMENDFHGRAGLDGTSAGKTVAKLARKYHVRVKPIATYEAMPIIREIPKLSDAAQRACLTGALDDIDIQTLHADAAARAWAVGDIAGVKAHYSENNLYSCFDQTKSFAAVRETLISDVFATVRNALAKPGKTLVVLGIGTLLRKGGLLDRLEANGIAVSSPAD